MAHSSDEIIAGLSKADQVAVTEHMAEIEQALERRSRIVSWLLWLLDDPRIQQRINKICQ